MSKCTAAQAVKAISYWLDYYEKASTAYVKRRDKEVFPLDKGDANYTYMGYLCGIQGGAWCAMTVSTAIYEACGDNRADAKRVLHGVWPYAACNQLYDAAPPSSKGRRGEWDPQPGDVIVFGYSSRDHTGIVYAVDGNYVYTIEGNSSNMCRKRSYLRNCSWIWGYVRPDYADGGDEPDVPVEQYGAVCCTDPALHMLSKGCAGPEVKTVQRILYSRGITGENDKALNVDGDFGRSTKAAVVKFQALKWLTADGIVGRDTWAALVHGDF